MLHYIIPSKTRRKILALFFENPTNSYHLRKVGREVGGEINAVKRELDILDKANVLLKEKRLNKVIFTLNTRYRFYNEFLSLFVKNSQFANSFYNAQSRLGKIQFIVVSYDFINKKPIRESEIYILVIGVIVASELALIIKKAEETFPFEINYTVMTHEEFKYRKKNNDPFIWGFLHKPKIMIAGSEEDLMA